VDQVSRWNNMLEITTLVETLRTFFADAINEDKDIAWEQTVHKARQNQEVMACFASVRKLLKDVRLELEPGDPSLGGYGMRVLRDENITFEHAPTRHFVQLVVSCSLRGLQRCEYEGIKPTTREVVVQGLRFDFIMVDGLVSSMSPPLMLDETVWKVLRAEREAYDKLLSEKQEQDRQRKHAKAQRDAAHRIALQAKD